MTSPVAPMPNETPEQRQARLDAAYRAHAELMARQRAAEQARMMPTPEPMPMRMPMETPIAQQRPDPDFNINIAMNTFNKQLGERVRSGQMTVAQAQAAQADMRALQLNPAAANRQAATDIAQRHLQVGKYHPENIAAAKQPQGGLTMAEQPEIGVTRPMPQGVGSGAGVGPSSPMPVMPTPMPRYDTPTPTPSFDRNAALREINTYAGDMNKQFQGGIFSSGVDPMQLAKYRGDLVKLTTDMNSTPEQHQQALQAAKDYLYQFKPVEPSPMPAPQGLSLSNAPPPQSIANAMQQPQGLSLSNVPRALTLSNVPQQPAAAPQGMAMGGLMAKYYGGAC